MDLRWDVLRVRRESADISFPHLAARCSHRGAYGGVGHLGGCAFEAWNLRFRAGGPAYAARSCRSLGAGDRAFGRHRDHLRGFGLLGSKRHETAHRVQLGGAHGLRDARHRHDDRLRHQRRCVRHGGARADHGDAVLLGRLRERPLPHLGHVKAGRASGASPQDGLDFGVLRHGFLGAARLGRFLGRVPGDLGFV